MKRGDVWFVNFDPTIRRLGTLSQEEMDKVSKALSVVLGTY